MRRVLATVVIAFALCAGLPGFPAAEEAKDAKVKLSAQEANDRQVEKTILAMIRQDPFMRESNGGIKVKVRNGTVYLYGRASTLWDKMQATLYARKIEGVGEVHNCVKVHYKWPCEDSACGNCCNDPIGMRQWY
jgi:hypothetical protein